MTTPLTLAPLPDDPTADPNATPKPKPLTASTALPSEYPDALSTTGTPQSRLQLATTAFDTFAKSTEPQYAADLKLATHAAAGNGQLGSGGLRTTYGNLANQRALALDTQRDNLINAATTGTIADQQANQGLGIQQQNANTAQTSALGGLGVQQGQLALAQTAQATNANQTQQQIDLAKKTADINAAYQAGTLTIAQRDQALRELANTQSNTIATGQLTLAQQAEKDQAANASAVLALQQKAEAAQEAYQSGTLTLAQRDQVLKELAEKDNKSIEEEKLSLAKDQLTQQATQFGLSLAQQKDLATLADKTANRQLDISGAQGQNSLLLELARIMGTSTTAIDPKFIEQISKALGITTPTQTAAGSGSGSGGTNVGNPYQAGNPTVPGGGYGSPYGS